MQGSELDWSLVAYAHVQQGGRKRALDAFFTAHTVVVYMHVHVCACQRCMNNLRETHAAQAVLESFYATHLPS